jgi:hypothetical protein
MSHESCDPWCRPGIRIDMRTQCRSCQWTFRGGAVQLEASALAQLVRETGSLLAVGPVASASCQQLHLSSSLPLGVLAGTVGICWHLHCLRLSQANRPPVLLLHWQQRSRSCLHGGSTKLTLAKATTSARDLFQNVCRGCLQRRGTRRACACCLGFAC